MSQQNASPVHTLHIKAAPKQKNFPLLVAFFRPAIWLDRSQLQKSRRVIFQILY